MQEQSAREGLAPSGQLASLPVDILQKVASLMPLKDWARASGACCLMHTLQLDVISIAEPFIGVPEPRSYQQGRNWGLQWVSRRWRCARRLHLEVGEHYARDLAAVLFRQQPQERPSGLRELSFLCHPPTAAASALLPGLLLWLASCTPQLLVLLFQAEILVMVPPLAQLQHLVLAQRSADFWHVAAALPQLQGLQTLSLECTSFASHTLPLLELQGLGHLRRLHLDHVAASRLALPEECRVSVRMDAHDEAMRFNFDWTAALPVLHSLHLAAYSGTQRPTIVDLQDAACLKHLSLHSFEYVGTQNAPWTVGGVLAQLESLTLVAQGLVLIVPADACWRVVRLHASQQLSLQFEDVTAFAATADVFSFVRTMHNNYRGSGLSLLGKALTALGKGWTDTPLPSRGSGRMAAMHSLKAWCAWRGRLEAPECCCMCGACLRCLHRAGLLSATPPPLHPLPGADLEW